MDAELKRQLMTEIENNVPIFKPVSKIRWKIRCPFCGDSQKDLRDAHMYLKCDYDNPNEGIEYYCFLANCNAHGKNINKYFMNKLGIQSKYIDQVTNDRYSKLASLKETDVDIITGIPDLDSIQVKYIEHRLGTGFTLEDYENFKIIWDMNEMYKYIGNQRTKNMMPSNNDSISFLSDDKSTLLSRGLLDGDEWRKIKLFSSPNRLFYTIKRVFNLFTSEIITVNIAEGIFDILSVYKNFNDGENSAYIATLGPDYVAAVNYAIMKGLVGLNVVVKIYVDEEIDVDKLRKQLRPYKYYFNKIAIFKNAKSKDVGVRREKISLIEK